MKINRVYRLEPELSERMSKVPITRTRLIELAIKGAHEDENTLPNAIAARLKSTPAAKSISENPPPNPQDGKAEWVRASCSVEMQLVLRLDELAKRARLSIEDVLKLAVEDYLNRRNPA